MGIHNAMHELFSKMVVLKDLQEGLYVGWAVEDITPVGSVSLFGQYYERISEYVESQLEITACAIESVDENGSYEQAIMVSMDVALISRVLQDSLKNIIEKLLPDFDVRKLFLNTTHTHSAPNPDVNSDYGKLLLDKLSKVVIAAWNNRELAGISRGLGYAVVGHNRRVQYADGTAEMYGATDRADFIGLEGPSDSGVGMVFCWDKNDNITGIIMNVSCPAQVTEAKNYISADYWSEVRKQLKKKFSKDIYVLAQCGAAGDISPRDLPQGYKAGEPNMWDIPGIIEIGKRLLQTVEAVYTEAKKTIQKKVFFKHIVKDINIPTRIVSNEEYGEASKISTEIHSREPLDPNSPDTAWNRFLKEISENEKIMRYGPWDNKNSDYGVIRKKDAVLEQYKTQEKFPVLRTELHIIRLGEVAIASNPFELFVDYGLRIKGRSKAKQTFIVQLSGDYCDYLPTIRALQGGGYSAMANMVGPIGGNVLVNETVELINSLWE